MSDNPSALPSFVKSANFPFEGQLRVKRLDPPVGTEPAREGEDPANCVACGTADEAYIWVSDRWRVRAMDRPGGLPMVLILESRSHLDLGDLPNLLAAELGVMTVRLERAIRSLDGVASVHVNRWADGPAHLHLWFLARPVGHLQLRGTFLSMWDDILERVDEPRWREDLALVAAWLGEFGGRVLAEPPRIEWHAPSRFSDPVAETAPEEAADTPAAHIATADSPEGAHIPAIPTQRTSVEDAMSPDAAAPSPAAPQATAPEHQPGAEASETPDAASQPSADHPTGPSAPDHLSSPHQLGAPDTQPATPGLTNTQPPIGAPVQPPLAQSGNTQTNPGQASAGTAPTPAGQTRPQGARDDSLTFLTELSGGDENYDFADDARAPAV